ncbi:MAG: hypothetical protein Q8R33_16535 [Burkholderiales bacterium]|nr:hypothetical protein [Burkholderiales bacterium]
MATEYTEERIREARLIVARPEQVLAELEKYGDALKSRVYNGDKDLERSLLARNEPLIDLGLARYAREKEVVAALYQKSRATPTDLLHERYLYGLGVACLSNEVEPWGFSQFPENIIGEEETARLIAENDGAEIAALLSNRNFARKIEALYNNEGLFAALPDERRCGMVHLSITNPRLITNERSGEGPDLEYRGIHKAILTMIASVPTTENWLLTLRALLDRLDPGDLCSPADGPITPILERWAQAPAAEKDISQDGYFTTLSMRDEFRCLVAAMYGRHYLGKDDKLPSSIFSLNLDGEILRCAYYGNAQLTEKEMRSGFDRDQDVYLLAVLCNDSVYHKPTLRKLLEGEQLRGNLRYTYLRRCEQIHKRWPAFDPRPVSEWLIDEGPPESKEMTMIRQLEATFASITKAVKSVVKSVQTWIFWGSLVLGALGVALYLKRCTE